MVSGLVQGQKLKSLSMHSARSESSTRLKVERLHGSTEGRCGLVGQKKRSDL